jgi:XTP/dITP diphosphohydrolase
MTLELVIATRNRGKLAEYRELLAGLPVALHSLDEYAGLPEVAETGSSFAENALLKARAAAAATGLTALADDSGLEVDYLDGAPGIYSSRYAGEGHDDSANNRKLLDALQNVPENQRRARFRCVIAIVAPRGGEYLSEGVCEGRITEAPRGESGFGYDPLFLIPSLERTFAELGAEAKNKISHRARAMQMAREMLSKLIAGREVSGSGRAGRSAQ